MTVALRWLGLDEATWAQLGPRSWRTAMAVVVVASGMLALNRFGGLVTVAPRAFVRVTLIGVWGWIGLSLAVWIIAWIIAGVVGRRRPSLGHTLGVVGWAHVSVAALGGVVFVAANVLQLLGPGRMAAMFVLAFWFPAAMVAGVGPAFEVGFGRALAIVVLPYLAWFWIVALHLLDRVEHLL